MEQQTIAEVNDKKLCTACGSAAIYTGSFVEFLCPNCNGDLIRRCEKCKNLSNNYKCKKCGFEGP
ncbi:MAG: RNA-binding protein [Candidatus Aenigmarchaeota archaeon]|nr:RNA-binding protein [Candidatus Aenigmarchaeota archaeon]